MCARDPLHCIIPPYIIEHLAQSADPEVRCRAIANLAASKTFRAVRTTAQAMPGLLATMSPARSKHRLVYDAGHTDQLPGALVRAEGQNGVADPAVNEAYDGSGDTYDFFHELFQRNSLDANGMSLISTVHVAEVDYCGEFTPMNNAFWNGQQMAYGDGDGSIFQRFTRSLEVIGHELSHGVQSFTSNLSYFGQSGALNEHFADVFGILVRQWRHGETAADASWLIGAEVLVPAPTRRGIRDMEKPGTAFVNDPELGNDPQPAHMSKLYTGPRDNGGVHINSGIPNRAFVLVAKALGGNAWDVAGRIWYETLVQLTSSSQFVDCARVSVQIAGMPKYGAVAKKAVKAAWKQVGIQV
ncbi:M4 family peptidase [Pseudomonas cavernae]|uniref:Neutral metalloproteinase n=1 Tax=Pseudomonas cavernae TaxID=2320867 RepID=A0A385Z3E7_9PSED|nr:M4 family metallopeptidase [Pseudomonas cavernae]AYC33626.1 M4 family peptidase [Pseudomonas cavernae]